MIVTHLTVAAVKFFLEVTLSLLPKNVHTLQEEGIIHLMYLALFNITEFESVIRSVKGNVALPGLAQYF